jgi:hypothetical protein
MSELHEPAKEFFVYNQRNSIAAKPGSATNARLNWLESCLFPRSPSVDFLIIACLSLAMSFLLIGRQVWQANWGLIDDHEVFRFLGPGLHLPMTDIWSTLLAKTEVGSLQGRFRPAYYVVKMIETSLWGDNVHLWYLGHTIGFAIFLGSIWWTMRRFVGGWLSGVLTASISLLPLWAGVWSRLGPSEIYGATCIGIMVFAADSIFFSDSPRIRNLNAIVLTLATVALVGMKETFIPLAGGTAVIFIWAGLRKRLSPVLMGILALVILACVGGIVFVVRKQVLAAGTDFYANSVGPWRTLTFAGFGFLDAILRTWWLYVIPILFFQLLRVLPRKPLGSWIADSRVAVGAYGFLVVTYAAQCGLYRSPFPHHSRYDFPGMLLLPLTCCILACDISCKLRACFSERTINYAQFAAAAFLFFAVIFPHWREAPELSVAVKKNIETTNSFYVELQRALRAAEMSPESPVILEAYGPGAYEPVFSLSTYLPALGARNPISVRVHPDEKSNGKLYDGLEQGLLNLEQAGAGAIVPLRDSLAGHLQGCISIGINGLPDAACSGFRVNTIY